MTILLLCEGDAQRFACQQLAAQIRLRGRSCLTVGPQPSRKPDLYAPLPQTQTDLNLDALDLLGTPWLEDATAIGVFLQSSERNRRFLDTYRLLCRHRQQTPAPLFNGPLTAEVGDRLTSDLSNRLDFDLLMVPGERQRQEAEAITFAWPDGLSQADIIATGLWFLPERPMIGGLHPSAGKTLVALVQTEIPTPVGGKSQLLRQLVNWAEMAPEWRVIVVRDHVANARQPWLKKFSPEEWAFPTNMAFAASGQMLQLLASCSACLSVSSPWLMAPMIWGRHCLVVGDFGVHTEQGTTTFFGSGVMQRLNAKSHLDQMTALPAVNQLWLRSMGWGIHDGVDRLLQRLDTLRDRSS